MPSPNPPALCLFVRDEVLDITEWLLHHAAIGCGRFLIYDNGSTDGTSELLMALAAHLPITCLRWPGDTLRTLLAAYEDCIARFGTRHPWIGFLEVDEFLIPPPGGTLGDLLARHDGDESFVISRLTFGSSGLRRGRGRPVMQEFTRRGSLAAPANAAVRSFVRPGRVRAVVNPCLIATGAPAVTLAGVPAEWSTAGPGVLAEAQMARGDFALHHYATRSDAHWVGGRGRPGLRSWRSLRFEEADLNDESDPAALPYAEQVAAMMQAEYTPILARHVVPRMHEPPAAAAEDVVCHIDAIGPNGAIGWVYSGADPVVPPAAAPAGRWHRSRQYPSACAARGCGGHRGQAGLCRAHSAALVRWPAA